VDENAVNTKIKELDRKVILLEIGLNRIINHVRYVHFGCGFYLLLISLKFYHIF
jgi:hypothetical protein